MIMFDGLNDYELLYLIKEGNEKAYEIMIKKYEPLIKKMSYKFYCTCEEDKLYDGYLVLNEAIRKFDEAYNKTFTRFFELLLIRYYCTYLKKVIAEEKSLEEYAYSMRVKPQRKIVDQRVKKVYMEIENLEDETLKKIILDYFDSKNTISKLCKLYNYNSKKVYNTLYSIKNKLKNEKI